MKNLYLVKALRAYRHVTYGQFDQETSFVVQETQDAADAIEKLERENAEMLAELKSIAGYLEASAMKRDNEAAESIRMTIADVEGK